MGREQASRRNVKAGAHVRFNLPQASPDDTVAIMILTCSRYYREVLPRYTRLRVMASVDPTDLFHGVGYMIGQYVRSVRLRAKCRR